MDAQLDSLKYDANGLVPAIIQDHKTGEVLAMFWMNREAIETTIATKKVHSYSRSRKRLALKGESSGHFEHVKSILADCDRDALVIKVEQVGGACHEGYYSCFFNEYNEGASEWKNVGKKMFDPHKVYNK
jgi:phosphoribosyl-AMP cyclohydrolase